MTLEVKTFTPAGARYREHLILTKDGGDSTLAKVTSPSGIEPQQIEPKLYKYQGNKYCNEGVTIRKNLETGAETRIENLELKVTDSKMAKELGLGEYSYPRSINSRHVKIDDCGTKLDLITYKGKVVKINSYPYIIGDDLSKITPFTRKWLKQFIDFMGKVR